MKTGIKINHTNRQGFTLVELLVVISIIALLLSILMPALNKVRNQARIVYCASNLKQLGLGVSMYMSVNRDHYPPYYMYPETSTEMATLYYDTTSWPRLIQRYIDGGNAGQNKPFTKAFYCPLGPLPGKAWRSVWQPKTRKWTGNNSHHITYGYNGYALGNSSYFGTTVGRGWNITPTSASVRASEFLVIVDNVNLREPSNSFFATPGDVDNVSRNHPDNKANVLYGDLHIAPISRVKLDAVNTRQACDSYPWKWIWEKK